MCLRLQAAINARNKTAFHLARDTLLAAHVEFALGFALRNSWMYDFTNTCQSPQFGNSSAFEYGPPGTLPISRTLSLYLAKEAELNVLPLGLSLSRALGSAHQLNPRLDALRKATYGMRDNSYKKVRRRRLCCLRGRNAVKVKAAFFLLHLGKREFCLRPPPLFALPCTGGGQDVLPGHRPAQCGDI